MAMVAVATAQEGGWHQEKGRGLIAAVDIPAESAVFFEKPTVAMQYSYSSMCSVNCANCFRFLGSLTMQLERVFKLAKIDFMKSYPDAADIVAKHEQYQQDHLHCRECSLYFCDTECKKECGWHWLLCEQSYKTTTAAKWEAYKSATAKLDETLVLIALLIADLVALALRETTMPNRDLMKLCLDKIYQLESLQSAPWHELERCNRFNSGDGRNRRSSAELNSTHGRKKCAEFFHTYFMELLSEQFVSVSRKFSDLPTQTASFISKLKSFEFFVNTMGTFELVNVNIEFPNPFNASLRELMTNDESESIIKPALEHYITITAPAVTLTGNVEERCATGLMADFMGVGLYPLVALANHSCDPNCIPDFPKMNLECMLLSLEPIKTGTEITLSYIDESLPLGVRQKLLLQERNFVCRCSRCLLENEREKTPNGSSP